MASKKVSNPDGPVGATQKLKELVFLFFRLGLTAFGGPAAHVGMMEEEVVSKRRWMTREHFLDLVGATNLIPGPNSTEMAIHCGYHYAGYPGLIAAGASFIFPAALLTIVVAWFYTRFGSLPQVEPFLVGIRPAVLAIILSAVVKLGQKAVKSWELGLIGAVAAVVALFGVSEIIAILVGGVAGMVWLRIRRRPGLSMGALLPLLLPRNGSWFSPEAMISRFSTVQNGTLVPLHQLFLSFLRVGSVLFGSGYVLVAYLEDDLVHRLGWLSQQELLDAIAAGQFTPGPVLTTSTFVGFLLHGFPGAVVATLGIFIPSFVFVAILNPLIPKLRHSVWASTFLDAVNVCAVGIMVAVMIRMGINTLVDWRAWLILLGSVAVVFGPMRVNSAWVVLGGSLAGYLLYRI